MFNNLNRVRLICGVIGSGKDYAVNRFFNSLPNIDCPRHTHHIKFAAPMTKLASKIYKVNFSTEEKYNSWKSIPENREKLVNLAESMKELYGWDFWIKQTIKEMKSLLEQSVIDMTCPVFAISDFRFPFEYEVIKQFCKEHKLYLDIEFVNFQSDRYSIRKDHPGEQLAIYLIEHDYKPYIWTTQEFDKILNLYLPNTYEKTLNNNFLQNKNS